MKIFSIWSCSSGAKHLASMNEVLGFKNVFACLSAVLGLNTGPLHTTASQAYLYFLKQDLLSCAGWAQTGKSFCLRLPRCWDDSMGQHSRLKEGNLYVQILSITNYEKMLAFKSSGLKMTKQTVVNDLTNLLTECLVLPKVHCVPRDFNRYC